MRSHEFTLILDDGTSADSALAERLYAATEDIDLGVRAGVAYLACSREAETMDQAIVATLRELREVGLGLAVARVETSDRASEGNLEKGQDARAIAAVNAALELARWHGKPEAALQFLRPMAI